MREIIESWLWGKSDRTQKEYRREVGAFFRLVPKDIAEVSLLDLQRFASHLEERGLEESSQGRAINAVKSLFTFAAKHGHVSFNVAAALKPPAVSTNLAGRILTREAVRQIIEAGRTEIEQLFLRTTYILALRLGEACALQWIDFSAQGAGKIQVSIVGKGGKQASILVPDNLWQELQAIRGEGDRVFPWSSRTGHDIVKTAVSRAGLNPKISAHWLRHAHARHAIEAGAKIHLVRDTLRHSSIATTNCYLESFPDESSSSYLEI